MSETPSDNTMQVMPGPHRNGMAVGVFVVLACALVVIGIYFVYSSMAAHRSGGSTPPPAVGMYLSPNTTAVSQGQQLTVKIYANLGGNKVENATADIAYNPALLKLASFTKTAAYQPAINLVCSALPSSDCAKPAGQIVLAVGGTNPNYTLPDLNNNGGNGILLGTATFDTLASGTAAIRFDPSSAFLEGTAIVPETNQNGTYGIKRH